MVVWGVGGTATGDEAPLQSTPGFIQTFQILVSSVCRVALTPDHVLELKIFFRGWEDFNCKGQGFI